jgi:hypothetical protein
MKRLKDLILTKGKSSKEVATESSEEADRHQQVKQEVEQKKEVRYFSIVGYPRKHQAGISNNSSYNQEKIKHNRRNLFFSLILIIIFIAWIVGFFTKPDTDPQIVDVIALGRSYAYYLMSHSLYDPTTLEKKLSSISVGEARKKVEELIQDTQKHSLSESEKGKLFTELKSKGISFNVFSTLLAKQSDLELIGLARQGSSVVIQFDLVDPPVRINDEDIGFSWGEIPNKGKMYFVINMRYELISDKRLRVFILNKIFNLPGVNYFLDYSDTVGRWVVYDFEYNYDLKEYYDWLVNDYKP